MRIIVVIVDGHGDSNCFNDDAKVMRKFICRIDDDCGEGVDDNDDGDDGDIYLRMRQILYTVFVNMVRNEQLFVVFDDDYDDDHRHHYIAGKN